MDSDLAMAKDILSNALNNWGCQFRSSEIFPLGVQIDWCQKRQSVNSGYIKRAENV